MNGGPALEGNAVEIDAEGMHYRELNQLLKALDKKGIKKVRIINVTGQRYIGTGLINIKEIEIFGTPGNDLGIFMNGPKIIVHGDVQDGCGNTMNKGEIIVYGSAGDILGYSMMCGKIFVKNDVGYRACIHMKEYGDQRPIVVIGGTVKDFLGEYMAGGILVLIGLGLSNGAAHNANYVGAGMHGGIMYIRGSIKHISKDAVKMELEKQDRLLLQGLLNEFCKYFKEKVNEEGFYKLIPLKKRPYSQLYAY